MEYFLILIINIAILLIIKYALNIKLSDIKKIKEIGYDKELNEITNKLPDNKEVCKEILRKLENENVNIQENEDKESELNYYNVINNKIVIANIKDTFTRIQTIAHECLHSKQNRRTLMFNYIFSNIYIIYFVIISILTILKVIKIPMIFLSILILLGIIYYSIRSYLETDAMTKAPYVAKEYMEGTDKLSKDEIKIVLQNYEELNKIGIPLTNYNLLMSTLIKNSIYCIITGLITIIV